jgi:hypothetical protein
MAALDPTTLDLLVSLMVVAAGGIVLGRHVEHLEARRPERCAACGRDLVAGRRCECLVK